MGALGGGFFAALLKPFERVLANRLQHAKPRFVVSLLTLLNQALVHQRGHQVEDVCTEIIFRIADSLGSFQRASAPKDTEPAQEFLLCFCEQPIAPVDSVTQRLLALGKIAGSSGQKLEAALESSEDSAERKHFYPGRCQFDCQRKTIHPRTNLSDDWGIL